MGFSVNTTRMPNKQLLDSVDCMQLDSIPKTTVDATFPIDSNRTLREITEEFTLRLRAASTKKPRPNPAVVTAFSIN